MSNKCTHNHTGSCSPDGVYLYVRCMDCGDLLSISDEGRKRLSNCPGYNPLKAGWNRACVNCGFDYYDHMARIKPMGVTKTVKVRVAVVVDSRGGWNCAGWKRAGSKPPGDTNVLGVAAASSCVANCSAHYWLEAELEVKEAKVVKAEVVKV